MDDRNTWYVDIPTLEAISNQDSPWLCAGSFATRAEAIAFAVEKFGADENGDIRIVSG